MANWLSLLKKGNTSSATAALGNTGLAVIKAFAASVSGSGTMFASAMHSVADAVNQGFVFVGSVLAERRPTRRFPDGFGRVINIFCMIAVIVVTVMAYETVHKGIKLLEHPEESSRFWLNFAVLLAAVAIDGSILLKATKEILKETRTSARGLMKFPVAFRNAGRAAPPTRLVFYEDIVATLGALFALVAIVCAQFLGLLIVDGIATILIGLLMVFVAFKVGYDNMVGLIGVAAPRDVEDRIVQAITSDPDVTDINQLRIIQEGRNYHVDAFVELRGGLTLTEASTIRLRLRDKLYTDPDISDVAIGILEDNGIDTWQMRNDKVT
ncbi:cation diffusion facilitator family transporter [Paenibacillus sabuli]|uniref:cation diffusion facilitator family transporter n=1 Tax=Paenibacillus sabuli TaxID=2772509 RepID=UPI001CC27574|nr:cation diffusion facilitator family transporter [Paenibacillus sabuli]